MVKVILRLEGLAVLLGSIWFFFIEIDAVWWLFPLLLLVPNLSMIGYVKDTRLGAITYDLMHTYILAVAVITAGVMTDNTLTISLGLILSSHIGMDRALEYGLKYPTHFKNTHFQRV